MRVLFTTLGLWLGPAVIVVGYTAITYAGQRRLRGQVGMFTPTP